MSVVEKTLIRMRQTMGAAQEAEFPTAQPDAPGTQPLRGRRAVPRWPGAADPPSAGELRLASQIRVIKRELLDRIQASDAPGLNIIMLTSAIAGEGKSFLALHLAQSFAKEWDLGTTLVDADTVRRRTTRDCGAEELPGLTDLLVDPRLSIEDVLLDTGVGALTLMPAGTARPSAAEALTSARGNALFDAMAVLKGTHVFIFDCSPLFATGEALAILRRAGQVVVVTRSNVTPVPALRQLMQRLRNRERVSLVLNGHTPSFLDTYYDYYPLAKQ